ncbi:MAG: chromosome partitioning protein ParB [Robiginitomaculum sp.]|nr:MAG: chromosome partitioning protein ParB [Robiginitomaculum sp.]
MKNNEPKAKIISVAIDSIHILNPRARNQKIFFKMVENIKKVGLKRPITVTKSHSSIPNKDYDLVCGQGRLEALSICGETHIPAIIIDDSEDVVLLKSLIENFARRQHQPLEHLAAIKALAEKGYSTKIISKKIGLGIQYINTVIDFLKKGETRLLIAVERGHLPLHVALQISNSPGNEQQALHEAYENNDLRGRKLKLVQQVLELRKLRGKDAKHTIRKRKSTSPKRVLTGQDVMKIYHKEVARKQLLTRKSDTINRQISFITTAMKQLLIEDHFTTLLRAEEFNSMPKKLAELLEARS